MSPVYFDGYKLANVDSVLSGGVFSGYFDEVVSVFGTMKTEIRDLSGLSLMTEYPSKSDGDAITATEWCNLMYELWMSLYQCCNATHMSFMPSGAETFFYNMYNRGSGDLVYQSDWNQMIDFTQSVVNTIINDHNQN